MKKGKLQLMKLSQDSPCEWLSFPWRITLDDSLEAQSDVHPLPFDYFCLSSRSNLSTRFCKLCLIYFPTVLLRGMSRQRFFSNTSDADFNNKVPDYSEEQKRDKQPAMPARNLFSLFSDQFEEDDGH